MNAPTPNRRREVLAVFSLFGVAILFALALLIAIPVLSSNDPVGPNVIKHRLRKAFCDGTVPQRVECLQVCADEQGAGEKGGDYKTAACGQLPTEAEPARDDQQRLEAELHDRSPCARRCKVNWKTHGLWCAKPVEKAKHDAVDACIFEGATMALFDWKEARCQRQCPESKPGSETYLTSADSCMMLCLLATLTDEVEAHQVKRMVRGLQTTPDFVIRKLVKEQARPALPPGFDAARRSCRLAHVRATWNETLESKRAQEHAFRDCVAGELPADLPTAVTAAR